jgi:hypothetical protein
MAEDSGRNLFEYDGRTQAAHRALDWSATPLGPVAGWPRGWTRTGGGCCARS